MSRTSLHRPRCYRAVCHRPATGTRLLPSPFPPTILHINTHYKRCPKALRLRLRSDQSTSRPLHGRSPDKSRLALSKGYCQVRAPLTRRIRFASSGDALEHSVMSPPWAIAPPWATAPFSDSAGLDLARESEQSDERRLKTNAPFLDSTVVTIGYLRSTNAGHGSTLPSLGMVEHFWWWRLPHREPIARLHHVLSEVRGCRRAVADVKHPLVRTKRISTGVDAFSRNRPGPSIPSLPLVHFPTRDDRPVAQGVGAPEWGVHTPPPPFYHSEAPRGISDLPAHPSPLSPHPTHERNRLLAHLPHPHPRENQILPQNNQTSPFMPGPSAQSGHQSAAAVSVVPPVTLG